MYLCNTYIRLTFMNWLWDRHGTWNPTRACGVVSLRAVSLTQLCKFDCAKEVLESAILRTKGLTAPPPSGLYRIPYVRGGPRLHGRSFGLCWNSGQNDLHIEFLVLLPLHRLQIVATTHLHIFRDPSERISNVEVLSRPLDYPLRKVYSSFSWGYFLWNSLQDT